MNEHLCFSQESPQLGVTHAKQPDDASEVAPERINAFTSLIQRVHNCHLCPRMEGRLRVLSKGNGPIHAAILFVAEAPGRLGADRSGIPLSTDQTGRNFELLLQAAHLQRHSIFITNSILCNPRTDQGNNAPPTTQEMVNCSSHLRETLQIVQPQYVIALGQSALRALKLIAPHDLILARDVSKPVEWNGRWLIALYHPGPRTRIHRPFDTQLEDFRHVGMFVRSKHTSLS